MPEPEASLSRIKSYLKSGKARTGAVIKECLRCLKAVVAFGDQLKAPFLNKPVSGLLIKL